MFELPGQLPSPYKERANLSSRQKAVLLNRQIQSSRHQVRHNKNRMTWIITILSLPIFAVGIAGIITYNYYNADLPDPTSLSDSSIPATIQILDRNGNLLYIPHINGAFRSPVKLNQISPLLQKATIDLEDKSFYKNNGLDYSRLIVALYDDLTHHGIQQGASTITQQLAKRLYLTPSRSLDRKAKEALLAQELDTRYSKDEILAAYLNEIYYGHKAYGIEAASEIYFNKHAIELNLNEASLLAAIPASPSFYDPLTPDGLSQTRQRQTVVLNAMLGVKDITFKQVLETETTSPTFHANQGNSVFLAPHFVNYVLSYLNQKYGSSLLAQGGLKITTTLDLNLQLKSEAIVKAQVGHYSSQGVNNGAMEVLDPNTGQILSYVGSADYYNASIDGSVDNVSNIGGSPRQPGSSFKPYVYLTAFSNGYTPTTILNDLQGKYDGTYYHDYDNRSEGPIPLRNALVGSRNIPTILLMQQLGADRIIQTVRTLGITTPMSRNLGTAIGASEVHMIEQASAYGVFATQGIYRSATPILKIEDLTGKTLIQYQDQGIRVASPQATYILNDLLMGYPSRWGLHFPGPTAGKSGTTDNNADLWYMGYTPNLVVASWMARTGPGIGLYSLPGLYGVTTSAHMVEDVMSYYYSKTSIPNWTRPPEICGYAHNNSLNNRVPSRYNPITGYCGGSDLYVNGTPHLSYYVPTSIP